MSTRWRVGLTAAAVLIALAVSTQTLFFYRDNFSTHYPIKTISADAFRSGQVPYWNYADGGGQPLAASPNTLTFYPDNILYLILPAHVAFNLHFWIHLIAAFWAMRALTRSDFAAWMWVLGGVAVSATAFYNLIVAVAMIPFAFHAAEKRSPLLLGIAFGLLALAGEPVTILATGIAVFILVAGRMSVRALAGAACVSIVVAAPLLIAYWEIAGEVERTAGMSARTVLNASLHPIRIIEIAVWPVIGVLNDPGFAYRLRLFSTLFAGLIVLPALIARSRYVVIAAVSLFFAVGEYNPIVKAVVEHVAAMRIIRYPEKFAMPLVAALVVLAGGYFARTRYKRTWMLVTFVPLIWTAVRALPIDRLAPYQLARFKSERVYVQSRVRSGARPARNEYRLRAQNAEPLFGATAGLRYVMNPSPDGMHALRSRMVLERFNASPLAIKARYLRLIGAAVPGALPPAAFITKIIPARTIYEEAARIEDPSFDEHVAAVAVAPAPAMPGHVLSYRQTGQTIVIEVATAGPGVLMVNQTFFRGWVARSEAGELSTMPIDIDRLGIIVPDGTRRITLRFGRHRYAVSVAWILSSTLLLFACINPLIEKRNRRAGQVQRSGDDDAVEV